MDATKPFKVFSCMGQLIGEYNTEGEAARQLRNDARSACVTDQFGTVSRWIDGISTKTQLDLVRKIKGVCEPKPIPEHSPLTHQWQPKRKIKPQVTIEQRATEPPQETPKEQEKPMQTNEQCTPAPTVTAPETPTTSNQCREPGCAREAAKLSMKPEYSGLCNHHKAIAYTKNSAKKHGKDKNEKPFKPAREQPPAPHTDERLDRALQVLLGEHDAELLALARVVGVDVLRAIAQKIKQ